jgi:hypothetical protein
VPHLGGFIPGEIPAADVEPLSNLRIESEVVVALLDVFDVEAVSAWKVFVVVERPSCGSFSS